MQVAAAHLVIPLFAPADAGFPVAPAALPQSRTHPVALGVMAGLVAGKPVGFAGQPEARPMAKAGVLFASPVAGPAGYPWLRP
jgi:Na+/H+ antiporter NhaA